MITYTRKPNRKIGTGVEAMMIGILIMKLFKLSIVVYQNLCKTRTFIEEIVNIEDTSIKATIKKIIYIVFLMYPLSYN